MKIKRNIVLVVTLLAGLVFTTTLVRAAFYAPGEEVAPGVALPSPSFVQIAGAPQQLTIPAIGVDATVQDVGVGKTGNMAVPSNYSDIGWYRYGTVPGNIGSAVMDGHVNNGFGLPAVFADLKKLKKGDDIYVESNDGSRVHFIVAEVITYAQEDVPVEILFNRKDASRLNLITCSGQFDTEAESYEDRTVVYAVLAT